MGTLGQSPLTPKSGTKMPDGPAPDGYKKSFPDKESPNSADVYDGSSPVFPLAEKDYLENADGVG